MLNLNSKNPREKISLSSLELNESNLQLFETIAANMDWGFWKIDLKTNQHYWSDSIFRLLGLDSKKVEAGLTIWTQHLTQKDEVTFNSVFNDFLITGEKFELETKTRGGTSDFKDVIIEGIPIQNNSKKPRYLGLLIYLKENSNNQSEADQELETIWDCSSDLIFLLDENGIIKKFSKSVKETLGFSKENILEKCFSDISIPRDQKKIQSNLEKVRSNEKIKPFKSICLNSDEKEIHLLWSLTPKKHSNCCLAIGKNITEILQTRKKQKEEDLRIQKLLDSSPDLIWSLNKNYELVSANIIYKKLIKSGTGWDIQLGDNLVENSYFDQATLDFWKEQYDLAFQGKAIKLDYPIKLEEKALHYETKIKPIKMGGIITGLACFSRNITEKVENTEKIKKMNARLIKGQEISKIGYWETNLETQEVYWSDEMFKIWETPKNKGVIPYEYFLKTIHPEDRKNFEYHRKRALSKERKLDVVYRILIGEKKVKYVHEKGELVENKTNNTTVFKGTAQEITKEKEFEIKLKERNFFIESTLNNIPLGIAVNKISDGQATFVNKAFEEIYGWPQKELTDVESFFEKVYPNPEYREWIKEQIFQDIQSGDPERMYWKGVMISTKNGEEKVVNAKNIPLPDLNLMISTVSDDTDRYWAEQALMISNDRFKLVSEAVSDAIWDWDLEKNTIFWGRGYHTIFGYPENLNKVDENAWLDAIHPDDFEAIWKNIREARENKNQKFWAGEYRFKRFDGTYAYVNEKTIILRNVKGTPVRMVGALHDITHEKEREEHLELLESVVTNTKDSIIITKADPGKDGHEIIYCNKAFEEMTGYKAEDIIGKTPKVLQGKESDPVALQKLREDIRNWKRSSVEMVNYKKDGTPFWIQLDITPVADASGWFTHWIGIQRDITENKLREQELELMNERFKLVTEATNDAIWDWDFVSGQHFWGEGFSKLFGVDLKNKKNSPEEWYTRIHPDDKELVLDTLAEVLNEKDIDEFTFEYRFKKSDGSYAYVLDAGIVVRDEEGEAKRLVGAIQDITPQKEYESSLRKLNQNLEKANHDLEISNQELEQFAYVASHDLQEPLRMISSFLSLLEKRYGNVLDEKGLKYIQFAVDGAKRMKQIILDLLEFSKLENIQESKEWIDSKEIIDTSLLFLKKEISAKNPKIHLGELPKIFGYKNSLVQLLQNLISNSLKYQPENQTPEIWINGKEKNHYWEFTIRDNGIGIDPAYLEKIFVIFQRLHTQEKYSGTGIGLALCKKITELHGGTIKVESEQGKGSTFFFSIQKSTNHEMD